AVGVHGRVYAVDAEPRMLAVLVEKLRRRRVGNVTPVLGLDGDPFLPERALDLILVVNTYHHFPGGPRYLRRLVRLLRPGGRIVNVDFHRRAGLRLVREATFLPHQYFLVLTPLARSKRS